MGRAVKGVNLLTVMQRILDLHLHAYVISPHLHNGIFHAVQFIVIHFKIEKKNIGKNEWQRG